MAPNVEVSDVGIFPLPTIPGMIPEEGENSDQSPPTRGQHGRQILTKLGRTEIDIERMLESGALTLPTESANQ